MDPESQRTMIQRQKVKTAGERLLLLEKPACKVGPWLVSENSDFRRALLTIGMACYA